MPVTQIQRWSVTINLAITYFLLIPFLYPYTLSTVPLCLWMQCWSTLCCVAASWWMDSYIGISSFYCGSGDHVHLWLPLTVLAPKTTMLKCQYRIHDTMFMSMHVWWLLQVSLAGMLLHSFLHSWLQGCSTHLSQLQSDAGACSKTQVMSSLHCSHNRVCIMWLKTLYPHSNFRLYET